MQSTSSLPWVHQTLYPAVEIYEPLDLVQQAYTVAEELHNKQQFDG